MPDFPSAFAATCDVPTASAVTSPVPETLTIFGSCTVQVMAAPGTGLPDPSSTCACSGSWALRTSVEVAGLTMIVATCGVASGAVLPHDQLESATATMVVSVRPILDISALRRSSVPSRALNFALWRPRTSALNRSIRSAVPSVHDYRDRTALPTGERRLGRDRDGSRPLPGHDPRRRHRRGVDVGARP